MVAKPRSDDKIRRSPPSEADVAEVSLLVPAWQIEALEEAARAEGITVAQLLRRAVNRTLAQVARHQAGYYYG
jgi:hypothetical protein